MKDVTDITVLLDKSGSMNSIIDDVIGGFNQFVDDQARAGGNAALTLVSFNSEKTERVLDAVGIATAQKLSRDNYKPAHSTPLLDALGQTVVKTGERLGAMSESDRPDKVVFVVITDGQENASKEYSKKTVQEMIQRQSKDYNWQFVYLGANQDAFAEAKDLGMDTKLAANFAPNAVGARASFSTTSENLVAYRGTGDSSKLAYTAKQRSALSK